jgi:hypothetical protein
VARRLLIASMLLAVAVLIPLVAIASYQDILAFIQGTDVGGDPDRYQPPFELTLVQGTIEPDPAMQKESTSDEGSASSEPAIAVVRVSGTPGTPYIGSMGTPNGTERIENVVGDKPDYYAAEVRRDSRDLVDAKFEKLSGSGSGRTLKVEILVDSEVVDEDETSSPFGMVGVAWSPRGLE